MEKINEIEGGSRVDRPFIRSTKELGNQSEALAARYLTERGYRLREKNYRTRVGEIDLICEQGDRIVFVEVRSKRSLTFGTGAESVIRVKQMKIRRVAEQYLLARGEMDRNIRFDVIEIHYFMQEGASHHQIRHIEGAF